MEYNRAHSSKKQIDQ